MGARHSPRLAMKSSRMKKTHWKSTSRCNQYHICVWRDGETKWLFRNRILKWTIFIYFFVVCWNIAYAFVLLDVQEISKRSFATCGITHRRLSTRSVRWKSYFLSSTDNCPFTENPCQWSILVFIHFKGLYHFLIFSFNIVVHRVCNNILKKPSNPHKRTSFIDTLHNVQYVCTLSERRKQRTAGYNVFQLYVELLRYCTTILQQMKSIAGPCLTSIRFQIVNDKM
jgi:hypothetical protein